jgi:hypothetical protein
MVKYSNLAAGLSSLMTAAVAMVVLGVGYYQTSNKSDSPSGCNDNGGLGADICAHIDCSPEYGPYVTELRVVVGGVSISSLPKN